jgi:Helix-turn-helix domain
MTSDGLRDDPLRIEDAPAMRALAHPLKWVLMDVLLTQGAATSTRCAQVTGESQATCSFHLRQLARYGLVEEAPSTSRKERPWRLTTVDQSWSRVQPDPQRTAAAAELERVFVQHEFTTLMRWVRTASAYGDNWQQASMRAGAIAWLTADELAGLRDQIEALMLAYRDRVTDPAKRPDGSRLVRLFAAAYPLPEDSRGSHV